MEPLPIDPDVRIGKLDNGLTYIIRHNEQPKNRANFYIAQRVGSMQEEDNQAGLAHFLEHLAFNGTRNFEGKELINYLESIGVKFGAELNAYTSFDETMYTIMNAPVERQGVVDSCLMILRDWSDGIALIDEEIDAERGVIEEEWRQSDSGQMRMLTELLSKMFPGLNYGKRMPIGSMDVVRNFTYQELRDYYHKWYRPDLQGLIIVGDIDVDYVENKIKELYADVKAPENPAERTYEQIPDLEEPRSIVVSDPEGQGTQLSFSYSFASMPREMRATAMGPIMDYYYQILSSMMNARFREITEKPNAPFVGANMSVGPLFGLVQTQDAVDFSMMAHEGRWDDALTAVVAEMKRARDHGFTAAEYDRAKADLVSSYENMLNSKGNRTNTQYAREYGNYFTTGGYIPGIETEYMLMSQLADGISVDVINQMFQQFLASENLIIFLMAQEKEGVDLPNEEELLAKYYEALEQPVEPYVDSFAGVELMEVLPAPGHILSEETDLKFGATLWTLSNGAKVYLLPTDYKKNDIRLRGISNGGIKAVESQSNDIDLRALAHGYAMVGGVADFSKTDLQKVLAGKNISVNASIDEYQETISGTSSDKDIETMFQMMYLRMTANRKDIEAFEANQQQNKALIVASKANPMYALNDSLPALMYPHSMLQRPLHEEEIDQIDYDHVLALYNDRFADASDFTFFLVGSFDMDSVQPLVERYIGGLPSLNRAEPSTKDQATAITKQGRVNHFDLIADTPTAIVVDIFAKDGKHEQRENMTFTILKEILSQQFFKSIREDEGGTYGVSVIAQNNDAPEGEKALMILFQTNPESTDHLNGKIKSELQQVANGEIDIDEYFNKTILNMEKRYAENIRENYYWMNTLENYYFDDEFNNHDNYLETLKSITIQDVRDYLQNILNDATYLELVGKTPESVE